MLLVPFPSLPLTHTPLSGEASGGTSESLEVVVVAGVRAPESSIPGQDTQWKAMRYAQQHCGEDPKCDNTICPSVFGV